jgi:hypothetical protein
MDTTPRSVEGLADTGRVITFAAPNMIFRRERLA